MKTHTLLVGVIATITLAAWGDSGASQPVTNLSANPAYAVVTDQPGLPRVLLIGDSISEGYTTPVRRLLLGKANVHRIPENGGPTTNGLARLKHGLGDGRWDVIHFNWGLHDLKIMPDGTRQVSLENYQSNLRELVRQLKPTRATLIWATTAPVPKEEGRLKVSRRTADVPLYNSAAREIMEENRIRVDDLYGFALPRLADIQQPADVHYTTAGYAELAKQVAASIEAALPAKSP